MLRSLAYWLSQAAAGALAALTQCRLIDVEPEEAPAWAAARLPGPTHAFLPAPSQRTRHHQVGVPHGVSLTLPLSVRVSHCVSLSLCFSHCVSLTRVSQCLSHCVSLTRVSQCFSHCVSQILAPLLRVVLVIAAALPESAEVAMQVRESAPRPTEGPIETPEFQGPCLKPFRTSN